MAALSGQPVFVLEDVWDPRDNESKTEARRRFRAHFDAEFAVYVDRVEEYFRKPVNPVASRLQTEAVVSGGGPSASGDCLRKLMQAAACCLEPDCEHAGTVRCFVACCAPFAPRYVDWLVRRIVPLDLSGRHETLREIGGLDGPGATTARGDPTAHILRKTRALAEFLGVRRLLPRHS
jgi:hypothetical protein